MLWLGLGRMCGLSKAKAIFISISAKRRTGLDKTVSTPMLSSRTVEEWIEEFRRLKKLSQQLFADRLGGKLRRESRQTRAHEGEIEMKTIRVPSPATYSVPISFSPIISGTEKASNVGITPFPDDFSAVLARVSHHL
jgi:hypothetical protein